MAFKFLNHIYFVAFTDNTGDQAIWASRPFLKERHARDEMWNLYRETADKLYKEGKVIRKADFSYSKFFIQTESGEEYKGNVYFMDLTNAANEPEKPI